MIMFGGRHRTSQWQEKVKITVTSFLSGSIMTGGTESGQKAKSISDGEKHERCSLFTNPLAGLRVSILLVIRSVINAVRKQGVNHDPVDL